jgi:hypothetical protein
LLFAHDLFGKPLQTFPDHALDQGHQTTFRVKEPARPSRVVPALLCEARWLEIAIALSPAVLRMISAQTRPAFVAQENRCTLFRIMR